MEARRVERQRRESAKSSAAGTLPSTQDEEFHLRLIDLYGEHACLWNTTLKDHEDVEMKRLAWEDISSKMGIHLTPSFVRSRISVMRHRLNVYKLQMLEYKISPASCKKPEKLYYIDQFNFLYNENSTEAQEQQEQEEQEQQTVDNQSNFKQKSIASIFKERLERQQQVEQLEQMHQLPHVLQRLSATERSRELTHSSLDGLSDLSIASVVKKRLQGTPVVHRNSTQKSNYKFPESLLTARRLLQQQQQQQHSNKVIEKAAQQQKQNPPKNVDIDSMLKQRMHRLSLVEQGKESPLGSLDSFSDTRMKGEPLNTPNTPNIPSVVQKRIRKQLTLEMKPEKSSSPDYSKFLSKPEMLQTLHALPGDSVSKTKMNKQAGQPKPLDSDESHQLSEDDDLYRLHWNVRQQQRSLRPAGNVDTHELRPQQLPFLMLHSTPRSHLTSSRDTKP